MDAGPIYGQSEFELDGTETKQSLADQLIEVGKSMIIELLPGILDGSIIALPQDDSRATYDKLITKDDGMIDLGKPAIQLEREVRAYMEWPKSRTVLAGKEVIITKAHVAQTAEPKQLVLKTAKDYIVIDRLKPAGKPEMSAQAFLAGYTI